MERATVHQVEHDNRERRLEGEVAEVEHRA